MKIPDSNEFSNLKILGRTFFWGGGTFSFVTSGQFSIRKDIGQRGGMSIRISIHYLRNYTQLISTTAEAGRGQASHPQGRDFLAGPPAALAPPETADPNALRASEKAPKLPPASIYLALPTDLPRQRTCTRHGPARLARLVGTGGGEGRAHPAYLGGSGGRTAREHRRDSIRAQHHGALAHIYPAHGPGIIALQGTLAHTHVRISLRTAQGRDLTLQRVARARHPGARRSALSSVRLAPVPRAFELASPRSRPLGLAGSGIGDLESLGARGSGPRHARRRWRRGGGKVLLGAGPGGARTLVATGHCRCRLQAAGRRVIHFQASAAVLQTQREVRGERKSHDSLQSKQNQIRHLHQHQ